MPLPHCNTEDSEIRKTLKRRMKSALKYYLKVGKLWQGLKCTKKTCWIFIIVMFKISKEIIRQKKNIYKIFIVFNNTIRWSEKHKYFFLKCQLPNKNSTIFFLFFFARRLVLLAGLLISGHTREGNSLRFKYL